MKLILYIVFIFISFQAVGQERPFLEVIETDSSTIEIIRNSVYRCYNETYMNKDSIWRNVTFIDDPTRLNTEGWKRKNGDHIGIWSEYDRQGTWLYTIDYNSDTCEYNKSEYPFQTIYYYADALNQTLGCAYDPNDKQVEPNQEYISNGQELDYLIRFQNTGNDTAFTVIIKDHLSTYLDWSSVQPVASSHEMEYSVNDGGELLLTFLNIQLPDSNTNLIGSQGFARFRINPLDNLLPNTGIHNTAEIYFDFNPAIITNTVTSTIECYIAPDPLINYEYPYLLSGVPEGVSYQWFLDGDPIFGATDHTFTPQTNGAFAVEVWDANGCSTLSEVYILESLSVTDRDRLTLNIYPIPSSGEVYIDFGQYLSGHHQLTIYTYQGKAVKQFPDLSGSQLVISDGLLGNGFYIAHITDTRSGEKVVSGKFIIAR